jgi:hypothetical protein
LVPMIPSRWRTRRAIGCPPRGSIDPHRWLYGHMPSVPCRNAQDIRPAACWMPKSADNSAASRVWVPADNGSAWRAMLHLSYGHGSLFVVLIPICPGGVVPLPARFISARCAAASTARRAPVCHRLRGWQTAALRDGCPARTLPDGETVPAGGIAAHANGFRVFSTSRSTVAPPRTLAATTQRAGTTGGRKVMVGKDQSVISQKEGCGTATITSKGGLDGRSVFRDPRSAAHRCSSAKRITAAGQTVTGEIDHTINQLAPPLETP